MKKFLNTRDLLFGFLFLLIFVSTCVSWQQWNTPEKDPIELDGPSQSY